MPVVPMDLGGDKGYGDNQICPCSSSLKFNLNRSIHQMGTRECVPLLLSPIRSVVSTGIRYQRGTPSTLSTREVCLVLLGSRTFWDVRDDQLLRFQPLERFLDGSRRTSNQAIQDQIVLGARFRVSSSRRRLRTRPRTEAGAVSSSSTQE